MANWQTVDSYNIKAYFSYFGNTSYPQYLGLQYDLDRTGPTSTVIRFIYKKTGTNGPIDVYYILLNPTTDSRTLIGLKTWYGQDKNRWPCCSDEVTLTKSYSASNFTVPALWICCDGDGTNTTKTADAYYEQYKDGGNRSSLKSTSANAAVNLSISSNVTVATNGSAPTISITDNGNNTATISGKLGSNGTLNSLQSSTLYYTTNGSEPAGGTWYTTSVDLGSTSGGDYSHAINIPSGCNKIWAVVYCTFAYNTTNTGHQSKSVTYYGIPGDPGTPVISYSKTRLTVKEPWTYTWNAASAGTNMPIIGYRIRLYKNNSAVSLSAGSGNYIAPNGSYNYLDRESTSTTVMIDPVAFGFTAGDTVYLGVYAYAKRGDGVQVFNQNGVGAGNKVSAVSTVQNAGIMRVKPSGAWKEGIVHVKVNGVWKEADLVQTKVSGAWKESE